MGHKIDRYTREGRDQAKRIDAMRRQAAYAARKEEEKKERLERRKQIMEDRRREEIARQNNECPSPICDEPREQYYERLRAFKEQNHERIAATWEQIDKWLDELDAEIEADKAKGEVTPPSDAS